ADIARIEAVDRGGLRDIEGLALGHALGDVEHHDVAQFLEANEVSQRSADLTGANQSNLVACHGKPVLCEPEGERFEKLEGWLSLSTEPFKSRRAGLPQLPGFRSGARRSKQAKGIAAELLAKTSGMT